MSPKADAHDERPAIGLRLVAVTLAVLPFGWMFGVSEGDLNASTPLEGEGVTQIAEAPETLSGPEDFAFELEGMLTDE